MTMNASEQLVLNEIERRIKEAMKTARKDFGENQYKNKAIVKCAIDYVTDSMISDGLLYEVKRDDSTIRVTVKNPSVREIEVNFTF